ncbi:MAG: hypothetical protein U0807_13620 [Candidatus Binatia bacterium]
MRDRLLAWLGGIVVLSAARLVGAQACMPACTTDAQTCVVAAIAERAGCLGACANAPASDALICRHTCRDGARAARRSCRAQLAGCAQACPFSGCVGCGATFAACVDGTLSTARACVTGCGAERACLGTCADAAFDGRGQCRDDLARCRAACDAARAASGTLIGTDPSASVEIAAPAEAVAGGRGQTVYLDFVIRNHGDAVTLVYTPTFEVLGSGATLRSVSGAPSSSGQTLSHNAKKVLRVSVKVDSDAPGGRIVVRGSFAFRAPEAVTVAATGEIVIPGAPTIAARCRTQLLDDHRVRVVVDVQNLSPELVKAIRITRLETEKSDGGRFQITSGRSPSVVYRLEPRETAQFSFAGSWNMRGVVRLFEGATAATRLNQKIVSDLTECTPALVEAE